MRSHVGRSADFYAPSCAAESGLVWMFSTFCSNLPLLDAESAPEIVYASCLLCFFTRSLLSHPDAMHAKIAASSARAYTNASRSFCTTVRCAEKPVMNRHSRIVTQPKDQGASQVGGLSHVWIKGRAQALIRPCFMLQMV
jgi:hypothetical protein